MPNLPPPPPAKGNGKGSTKGLAPPGVSRDKPQAPPAGPPVQVPVDVPGTLRSAGNGDADELFEDGLQWTRILKNGQEKSTQDGSQQNEEDEGDSSFGSSEDGEKTAAEDQGAESGTTGRSQNGDESNEEATVSKDPEEDPEPPEPPPDGDLNHLVMPGDAMALLNQRRRPLNRSVMLPSIKSTKSILKQTTITTEEADPILSLLSGDLASDFSPSGRNREPKVKIVDDQEEQRAQREALRLQEAKAHEKELRMQRRSQMLVWLIMLPIRSVTYLGSCCISSPKTRRLWLFLNLAVSLFELWTCALFWAFSMDSKKLTILGVLLTADHWVNAWFLVDAMLQALDQIRGPEAQDANEVSIIVMRKVDWREQMQQKAKSMFQKLPGFSACSTEFLSKIADVGEVLTKQKGDVLYGEQEDNTSLYLILQGEVVIRAGDHVSYVGEGGTLGEFKVFDMVKADSSHVECITECAIFEVSEREMKRFLESSPADRNMLLEFFKAQLAAANRKHGDGKWDMIRKGARKLFRPIVLFMESGVHGSRDIWLQAGFAIVLLVLGSLAESIRHAIVNSPTEQKENIAQNFFWILFLICKLMRQKLPLTYLKRFFVEQETQLFVNIRLTGSGGSTWVTLKLAVIMLGWGHWIGCIYLLVALCRPTPESGTEDSMFDQFRDKANVPQYHDEDWWGDYLIAYYRAFNKNYEGAKPERLEELVVQLLVVVGILAMKSYVIGSFFKLQEAKKESAREVEQLLNQADIVCNTLDLPPSIRKSIRQYCMFQWSKSRDVGNRDVVLKTFAADLQKKVKEQIYLPIIQANETLFHGVTSDFMLQIIDHLEVTTLQPSELLFCENDAPQELCFLETGTLMLTCQEQLVRYARSDRPNEPTAVGEVAFVLKVPHLYSVRSRGGVESSVLRLSRTDFEMIMANLDSDYDQMMQNAAHAIRLSLSGNDIKGDAVHDGQEDTELFQLMRESVRQVLLTRTAHISTTFINAAAEGNIEQVELLLRKRVMVDTGNSDGRTAMHLAASEGREHVMKLLIKAEGNVNVQDRWKGTPLRDAVMGKFSAVIDLLMDQHADLNLEDPATALCDAASGGNLMALQELIEVKIDPNSGDYDLRTALHLAASEGKLEVISFLLDSRADPNFKDRWGGTALEDAIQNNHAVAAQLIYSKKGGLRQDLAAGWLCDAAAAGNILKLQQLTENSVDVNSGDYDARTALHLAATEGQLLAVSFLIGSARAFTSPQDRWKSTPLQDAVRAGHTDCARLLAFTGGFLGDSATDEDREKLSSIISEDFSSPNTWPEVQKFQRRMNELNQRVSRLLVAVAKGKARPEVFDAEACTKFNRQLICAVFKQCPQLADGMLGLALIFRRLYADAAVPLQSFTDLLQDSVDCMKHSKWWLWYAKQGKEERRQSVTRSMREPKVEKSASGITKLLVGTLQIGQELAKVVTEAGKQIYLQVNREVNARRITRKDYVIDEASMLLRAAASNPTSQNGKSQTTKRRRKSFTGSVTRAPSAGSRSRRKGDEEAEDPRGQGNQMNLGEVCTESVFNALGWDVDWTAPASSNYGINAGAMKQQIEELAKVLASSQAGAVMEMWECLTTLPVRPTDAGAWRSMRRAVCCSASNDMTSIFGQSVYLKPMSLPLAFELAMLSVLALVRTAPLNIEAQPSMEAKLTRIDICVLRNALEAVETEVRGDIAKTQQEVLKKRDHSRTPGKKVIHMGGRFARVEPVSIGRILATQRDLSTEDLCAIIDVQDGTCQISAKMDEEDSDEDGKKRSDKKATRRKDNMHIVSHQSRFGVMSPERFQLNVLRHLLDFNSMQVDAIEEDERREREGVKDALEEDPFDDDFCFREILSSGEVVWYDDTYIANMDDLQRQGNDSEDSDIDDSEGSENSDADAQADSPPASPTSQSLSRRAVAKRDAIEDQKATSMWAKALQWLQSKQAWFGGKAHDQEAKLRQKVTRKFRELDEDGEGLALADVATLLTDVFGHQLDRDAMLRLAANVYDAVEKSEQELLQLSDLQDCLETATQDYEAMVKRQRQHSSQKQGANSRGGWLWVQRLAGYVMPPDSMFLACWDFAKTAVVMYYLLEVPMRFCFVNFDFLKKSTTLGLIVVNIGADLFMLANLPLNFLRGFEDSGGLVIRDFEQIRRRYLLGAFSWDLIAVLPFDVFADPMLDAERTYATWRLLKLIHLRHLWGIRSESKSSDQQEYGFALTTFIVLWNFCVLGHFMACFYWYIANGWPTLQQLEEQLAQPEPHTWFSKYQGMDYRFGSVNQSYVTVWEQYLLSFYSMMSILINDNNDILNPGSWGEVGWILVSFVVSVAVMGAIDGTLVGKVISQDETVVEQRVMKARINTFIKNAGLPTELVEQILVSEGSDRSQREGHPAADARTLEAVLSSLSHSLLQRIGRRVFLKWLSALPIFKDCSEPFLLELTTTCRPLSAAAGSFLCRAGELTSFFCILRSGSVQLRDASNEEVDRIDERGTALCDISCLFSLRHEVSIVSEEESTFIKVPVDELNTALLLYPKDHEVIHNNVIKLTPNPHKDGQDDVENQGLGMTWAEDEEEMGKSQVSASTRRKKRKLAGMVDLMAELPAHDLTLDGVARVRKEIKKFQKTQEQERIGDFMALANQGKWEAMEAMLRSNKVHVNCTNWDSRTALHVAVSAGHLSVVEKLVMDFSASFTVQDRFSHTPLDDAVRERHSEVAEFLIEASAEFKSGVAAAVQLCEAAANGDTAQLELLVEVIGVDPNLGDYDDRTALHLAASNGHLDTIQKMLEFPTLDLSPFDRFGLTPLDDAIRHGHVPVQKLLKHEGAQMGKVEFGVALCEAASQNDHNKIRQMIEAGVRAGMADYDYRTALHLAASNGHLETCVFLLREGKVDPNPLDRFLHTPLDDAIRQEHLDVVQLLMKYRGRPSSDEEYLGQIRNDFIKTMEEENDRKDSDKLEKELKTHGFADLLERLARFRTEVEEEAHLYTTCANNIRYDLCRILHASVLLNDETASSGAEKLHKQIMLEEGATIQRLRFLMEKDLKTLDSSTVKILEHVDNELMPWLNSLRSNTHTKGLLPLLLPNIFQDMEQLLSVLRHIKALLPQLLTKVSTGTTSVGYDCKPFGLLCCRFLQPRSPDLQDLLDKALTLLVELKKGRVTPWPEEAKTAQAKKLFRTSHLVETLTCGLDPPPFKPQEVVKRDAAAVQEEESM